MKAAFITNKEVFANSNTRNYMPLNRNTWSQEQLNFLSDVIAAAVLLKTDRLAVSKIVPGARPAPVELESRFRVQQTFKGEILSGKEVVVRHFEDPTEPQSATSSGGDHPDEGANYLLYLR